ncbi:hypothetical protein TOPH_06424 [Tolypocladium ophioglossoides CBS 100239]|uniref:Sphingoid long-chain base transporter RSB1 n=1 Tax=Tolypocladium ophioglossoides (strain CBS 100239) TaxID=1163406 RepID=A0A0L0N4F3_TOLOC|nr:hypothetical protein TOPH_06424 [Tolypocladium ophioglossoides CBS 100239]
MADDCGSTCPVAGGFYSYSPNVGGNVVLMAAFALLLPFVLYLGYRFRVTLFTAILATGLLLDVLGFAGRVLLHRVRDSQAYFTLSLLGTAMGPTFTTAAVILVLPHVLTIYGEALSPCRPILAESFSCGLTLVALVVQLVGIVLVAYGLNGVTRMQSAGIVAGGLAVQAVALLGAMVVYLWFMLGLNSGQGLPDEKHAAVYLAPRFERFLRGMEIATTLLLAYSIYRAIDMAGGVDGGLFQNEAAFMVVTGAVPLAACILLTVFHPGAVYGPSWEQTSPRRPKRRIPPPIQHYITNTHRAYDPNIRKQFSPNSPRTARSSYPPKMPSGSPGLPSNPRPSYKPPSPMIPSPKSAAATSERYGDGSERSKSQLPKNMVDSEALW